MFIADYDNLRFDFMIFVFWNGLGKIWERFGKIMYLSEIFRSARFWPGEKEKQKQEKKEPKKKTDRNKRKQEKKEKIKKEKKAEGYQV